MLRSLSLKNVGPSAALSLDPLASRLNLITGDNGLGKSFLLEVAWWALTRTWNGRPAEPSAKGAQITAEFDKGNLSQKGALKSDWDPARELWKLPPGPPPNPGMVLYARVDGSFSAFDPFRNYKLNTRPSGAQHEAPPAYQFSSDQVMNGLSRKVQVMGEWQEEILCGGLIRDWFNWQIRKNEQFALLEALLARLSPMSAPLKPGQPRFVALNSAYEIPTIQMPYGQEVPLVYAPAGVQRIAKLAYLLAWTLSQHERAAAEQPRATRPQLTVLIDEPETHLHPQWQRTFLPSLITALNEHAPGNPQIQLLVATHSPLVLASVEPLFDPRQDALWKLDLVPGEEGQPGTVQVERDHHYMRGDVGMWLSSDVFNETSLYSEEAERTMREAAGMMDDDEATEPQAQAVRLKLRRVLADTDPFWLGLRAWMRTKGWRV
ncbi:MAG: ATP-binding protein [Deltaproteobacteria bacterium]|nr:ATP-binding protein [Deltaproteobacteria bacterium]